MRDNYVRLDLMTALVAVKERVVAVLQESTGALMWFCAEQVWHIMRFWSCGHI